MHFDRSVKQQQKASFWDDLFAEESAVETMYGWQCSSSGVHPCMPHWHLTAKVQHGHAHVAPLLCIQSDVHSILMRDTRLKQCFYVSQMTQEHCTLLYMSLLEVKGTSGQLSYFHQSSFDKQLQRVMEEHALPL